MLFLIHGINVTSIQYAATAQDRKPLRLRMRLGNNARSRIRACGATARTRLAILVPWVTIGPSPSSRQPPGGMGGGMGPGGGGPPLPNSGVDQPPTNLAPG